MELPYVEGVESAVRDEGDVALSDLSGFFVNEKLVPLSGPSNVFPPWVFSTLLVALCLLVGLILVVWWNWGDDVLSVLDYDSAAHRSPSGAGDVTLDKDDFALGVLVVNDASGSSSPPTPSNASDVGGLVKKFTKAKTGRKSRGQPRVR